MIREKGWMLWPPIPFRYDTINYDLPVPAPAPPSAVNWLGTDDQGRDLVARLIYGFRISVLFGLILTLCELGHRRRRRRGPGLLRRAGSTSSSSASSRSGPGCRCSTS